MGHEVFVSYSKADAAFATEVTARLEACGQRVWIAPRDVPPSADWAAAIVEALGASRVMVLIFSSASNRSRHVRREVECAVHRDVPILAFRVEDVVPTTSLEYFLSSRHWLDAFPSPQPEHYAHLCSSIASVLSTGSEQTVAAARGPDPASARHLPTIAATGSRFASGDLERLATQLAGYVGPIAKTLVRRAAVHATSFQALTQELATEIPSERARRAFLDTFKVPGESS